MYFELFSLPASVISGSHPLTDTDKETL